MTDTKKNIVAVEGMPCCGPVTNDVEKLIERLKKRVAEAEAEGRDNVRVVGVHLASDSESERSADEALAAILKAGELAIGDTLARAAAAEIDDLDFEAGAEVVVAALESSDHNGGGSREK